MSQSFLMSLGLVFVIEGLFPFLAPRAWRNAMQHMTMSKDAQLRLFGLSSMLLGLALLYLFH